VILDNDTIADAIDNDPRFFAVDTSVFKSGGMPILEAMVAAGRVKRLSWVEASTKLTVQEPLLLHRQWTESVRACMRHIGQQFATSSSAISLVAVLEVFQAPCITRSTKLMLRSEPFPTDRNVFERRFQSCVRADRIIISDAMLAAPAGVDRICVVLSQGIASLLHDLW
jgi:hypothetical protein